MTIAAELDAIRFLTMPDKAVSEAGRGHVALCVQPIQGATIAKHHAP